MKVLLAGAFGHLGSEILKALILRGYDVVACDIKEGDYPELKGKYTFKQIDATNPETLKGIADGVDVAVTTMGLTTSSTKVTCYDVDLNGNVNFLNECKAAGVKQFVYISVISCDEKGAEKVPMLHSKYLFEEELKKSGLKYVIHRPTGYFYDIVHVFRPYVEKGEIQLLKNYGTVKANVVKCEDFATFVVSHLTDENKTYEVGGKETYTYEEMAKLCFDAAKKPLKIKYAPKWLFGILANLPKIKKAGKHDVILFSQWTLSHDLVGKDITGEASFKEYINECFGGK